MRYKAEAKCEARNHLVKNRWRISLRNILPYSLYFFKRYNAWGSQTNAFWRHNFSFKRMAGQMSQIIGESLQVFSELNLCSLACWPHRSPEAHTLTASVRHLTQTMHLNIEPMNLTAYTGSTINPPRNTLQRAVVWGCIVLLFCPFLGRVAPRPPWHKSRKTQANQKSLNNKKNTRSVRTTSQESASLAIWSSKEFPLVPCTAKFQFCSSLQNSRFTVPQVLPAWSDWHPHSVLTRPPRPSIGPQDSIHECDKHQKQIAYNSESITILTVWLVL